ncbi:3-keto-5-aminohexanoate cleavage protein, partial [Falsiroseomonas oryzae]|uniref:3-keto-5-aminohexanoate cleavage protein n=1 Tax=Falsiroseomonas oryzae TaxID=2766473 RepID=UPI0022EABBC9
MAGARQIQACLNGARARGFHPRLPVTPDALASDAAACIAAGAIALHIHPRDGAGGETLAPEAVGAAVAAVRRAVPGVRVSVSTGDWIEQDDARQIAAIRGW